MNEAIARSTGTYIYRAESDDICRPDLLKRLSAVLDASDSVGLVHGRTLNINATGESWRELRRSSHPPLMSGRKAFATFVLGNSVAGPITMIRRAALDAVGGFAVPPCRVACDWHFLLRLCLQFDVAYVDEALGFHRLHDSNFSAESMDLLRERYAILSDIFSHLAEGDEDLASLRPSAVRAVTMRAGAGLYVRKIGRAHV